MAAASLCVKVALVAAEHAKRGVASLPAVAVAVAVAAVSAVGVEEASAACVSTSRRASWCSTLTSLGEGG